MKPIIIIGTGVAGYSVATEYRKLDAERQIVLISSDDGAQYSKPMLSNAMAQKKSAMQLINTSAQEMASRLSATVLTHQQVLAINPRNKTVTTSTGEFHYVDLVLALGAEPVMAPLQGDGAQDVLTVNDLADYARLRTMLRDVKQVLIIGAGLIGCEFANDLLHSGIKSVVVDTNLYPLASLVPEPVGQALSKALEEAGVTWRLGTRARSVERTKNGYAVTLLTSEVIDVQLVISVIGLRPRTELAKAAGIPTHRGIMIDGYGQTGFSGVYALGDCAEYADGRLMPFIRPTLIAARSIAATLAGTRTRIDFPCMPVVVKTPAHPVVVLPARPTVPGTWSAQQHADGEQWLFMDADQRLQGYSVSGTMAKTHTKLTPLVGFPVPQISG